MFVGFFAFVLAQGPTFAKAVVDSLSRLGAGGGTASPPTSSMPDSPSQRRCRKRFSSVFLRTMRWRSRCFWQWSSCHLILARCSDFCVSHGRNVYRPARRHDHARLGGSSYTKDFAVPIPSLRILGRNEAHGACDCLAHRIGSPDRDWQTNLTLETNSRRHLRSPALRSSSSLSPSTSRTSCRASCRELLSRAEWKQSGTVARPPPSPPAPVSSQLVRQARGSRQLKARGLQGRLSPAQCFAGSELASDRPDMRQARPPRRRPSVLRRLCRFDPRSCQRQARPGA